MSIKTLMESAVKIKISVCSKFFFSLLSKKYKFQRSKRDVKTETGVGNKLNDFAHLSALKNILENKVKS